jgi:hypothetical protein
MAHVRAAYLTFGSSAGTTMLGRLVRLGSSSDTLGSVLDGTLKLGSSRLLGTWGGHVQMLGLVQGVQGIQTGGGGFANVSRW